MERKLLQAACSPGLQDSQPCQEGIRRATPARTGFKRFARRKGSTLTVGKRQSTPTWVDIEGLRKLCA